MNYVYEYDIAAIIFTLIVIITFLRNRTIETSITKVYTIIIVDAFLANIFDLVTNYTLNNVDVIPIWLHYIFLIIFFITYNSFPALICLFIIVATGKINLRDKMFLLSCIPYGFIVLTILISPFAHTVFYFDANKNYYHGMFFIILYVIAGFYICISLVLSFLQKDMLSQKQRRIFYLFMTSSVLTVIVQIFLSGLSMSCLVYSISIYFLYRTLKNPEDYMDSEVDVYNNFALKTIIQNTNFHSNKNKKSVVAIQLMGIEYLSNTVGEEKRLIMLKQIVNLLLIACGKKNLYRYSTSRFVAIIPLNQSVLEKTIEKIKCIFEDTFRINEMVISLSVRISYFNIPEDADDYETVFELIENSLDNLLDSAPGTVLHVRKDILEDKRREKYILKILKNACDLNDFEVYYQPVYSTKENRYVAAEALLRFKNPELRAISPAEFIPLAERNGMILKIEDFVLKSVCQFLHDSKICDTYFRCIYINISAIQYMQDTFISRYIKTLDSYGIDHKKIIYDVNELSSLITHSDFIRKRELFSEENIMFALNEFGYGSFDVLSMINYPIKCIKINKELVWSAEKDEDKRSILNHIIKTIEALNVSVIAEGVATEEQFKILKEMKCKYLQGFYFMKAVPGSQLLKELEENNGLRI